MENEVSPEQIEQWKKEYGRVQKMNISDVDYYYRPLSLDEYFNIQNLVEAGEQGELVTMKMGILSPELPEKPPAGAILKISDEILRMSGFDAKTEPEEL